MHAIYMSVVQRDDYFFIGSGMMTPLGLLFHMHKLLTESKRCFVLQTKVYSLSPIAL